MYILPTVITTQEKYQKLIYKSLNNLPIRNKVCSKSSRPFKKIKIKWIRKRSHIELRHNHEYPKTKSYRTITFPRVTVTRSLQMKIWVKVSWRDYFKLSNKAETFLIIVHKRVFYLINLIFPQWWDRIRLCWSWRN